MPEVINGSYHALRTWDDKRIAKALELKPGRTWVEVAELMDTTWSAVASATSRYELVDGKAVLKDRDPKPTKGDGALVVAIGEALWGDRWQAAMARAINNRKQTIHDYSTGRISPREGVLRELLKAAHERQAELSGVIEQLESRLGT